MFQEKSKQTCLEKYGKERYQNTDEFIQKRSNTRKERYSSAEAIQTINDKRRNTITQRYGGYDNLGRKKYDHEVAEYRKQFGDFVCDLILSKQKDDVVYIDRVKQHFNEEYIRKHFIVDKNLISLNYRAIFILVRVMHIGLKTTSTLRNQIKMRFASHNLGFFSNLMALKCLLIDVI